MRRGSLVLSLLLQVVAATGAAQEQRPDTGAGRRLRRIPVTPELERSAFADDRARALLHRARAARLAQDSALRSYDAKSYLRMSLGLGVRRLGPERLLFRTEHAARVRWTRESGVWIETTGRRHLVPMGGADLDLSEMTPVPYFPGREALWLPSSELRVVRDEVNEKDLLHPLATGAEAYYRYETGDSLQIRLSDGRGIQLRELRITARRPEWRAFVGSFWFDTEHGSLVRAAYRMAAEIDIWREIGEEGRRQVRELEERARTDTGKLAREARDRAGSIREEGRGTKFAGMLLSPLRAKVSGITVEYGLYEGRFWLPKLNVFEGELVAAFIRLPLRYEESYRYDRVNGGETLPRVPVIGEAGITADDTLYVSRGFVSIGSAPPPPAPGDTSLAAQLAREDSVMRYRHLRGDSLTALADSLERAQGDTVRINNLRLRAARNRSIIRTMVRRREECARDSTYFAGTSTMYDGALRIGIRFPCDTAKLAASPDLPASILTDDDQLFSTADRDQLLEGLDFSLQPGWGPQRPQFHTGVDLMRYNRIEGFSLGASLTSVLGMGYTAQALGRFGVADRVLNGELSLSRSNGRSDVALRLFHRLGVANDDWGAPLSFGASVANLLYARDEGFYYRTWGAEVGGNRDAPGPMSGAHMRWRLFAERQYSAGALPNTQASAGKWLGDARFTDNIAAQQLVAVGAAAELARSFGIDPKGTRFDGRIRAEGAATNRSDSVGATGYGRLVVDGTVSRPFGRFALAVTGAGGSSVGDLPVQRSFYVGGLHTVRGQFARPTGEGRVGDTFWLGRAELGTSFRALRPTLFYDVGWAGSRDAIHRMGRPLSGVGTGLSLLDGLFRVDVSRGIYPEQRWRTDLYIGARF
ncbi:MAG: hypothetical protein WD825_10665 [Gemmatimonadaceae bacterium]